MSTSIRIKLPRRLPTGMVLVILLLALAVPSLAQRAEPRAGTRVETLTELARELADRNARRHTPLYHDLLTRKAGPQAALNADRDQLLIGIENGRPVYLVTHNVDAAVTVGTDRVWPGGTSGLNLTGLNLPGELAIWDAGAVMISHQDFDSRVSIADGAPDIHYHATHVAGTLVGAGIDPLARGMSFAGHLDSYDWGDDEVEMAFAAAGGLLFSNHSYGWGAGWAWSSSNEAWFWYGDPYASETEDAGFGFYGDGSVEWDQIAHNAPYYLIVKSAGNDRNDYGPEPGGEHYVWDYGAGEYVLSTTTRDADGGLTGFDTVPYRGASKNILTVGAVLDVAGGWTHADSVKMSSFSGWGPTDDGRIKPDLVANGVGLYSTYIDSVDSYASLSGTSMSAPNTTGSLNLIGQQYKAGHAGAPARAATLKGLLIHTVNEAGPDDGPDYMFGWGLLDIEAAALLIAADAAFPQSIGEADLANGDADTLTLYSDGSEPIAATICWSDEPGTPPAWSVDPPNLMLVNDLDLRVERVDDATSYEPWILDPANPADAATTGDNFRDNVEKVQVAAPAAGHFRVIVSHKGSLAGGGQDYSLIVSGLGGQPQAPQVGNVTFAQAINGSGQVTVTYDVSDVDSPTVTITLEASADGGSTWDLVVDTVSGDVGPSVGVGAGRTIVWDFAGDNPGVFSPDVVLRITAEDGS